MGSFHLPLVQRLDRRKTGRGAGARTCRAAHFSRNSTDLAWAGGPSTSARATAAGPIFASEAESIEMKLVLFMKSSTERPLAKRARRPVGRTWLGPAT